MQLKKQKFFLGSIANIVGKGENSDYHLFLLFQYCYKKKKIFFQGRQNFGWCGKGFNSLPNKRMLDESRLKAGADDKINVHKIWFGKRGKRRKCWLPAFSPFPTMFSKGC